MDENPVQVGVLSFHESKESKAILNAVEELGHEAVWLRENDVLLRFKDGEFVLEPGRGRGDQPTAAVDGKTTR